MEPNITKDLSAVYFERGRQQGIREGRQNALNSVNDFVSQMMTATKPEIPYTSSCGRGCYRRHPYCALRSIHTFVLTAGAKK